MKRTTRCSFFWLVLAGASALLLNYNSAFAATGLPLNFSEARNLPSWIHLGTNPACSGFADDCSTVDTTDATGFTFSAGTTGTGGESSFNILTLPDGTTGLSGQALSTASGTDSFAHFRTLSGVPDSFRMWVVVDNGADPNFNSQSRLRVNIRNTSGPPAFTPEGSADSTGEALPVGTDSLPHRLIDGTLSDPNANNGTADAWSFLLSGVTEHDYITFQMTGNGSDKAAIAGFMIEPLTTTGARSVTWESANSLVNTTNYTGLADYHWFPAFGVPEPSSAILIVMGAWGLSALGWRRRG
ncbi:MAG TPA: PEP-CTERM sorting domain-containing protein [Lacipirellulaceae bacterium]|nr:PEP-CTERM sorting domain-containing protein [Lacipirellulaceae bacterium]